MPAPTGQLKRTTQAYDADADFFSPRATLAATTTTTAIAFDVIAQGEYKAQIFAAAYTGYAAGVTEWQAEVQVSETQAGAFVTVNTSPIDGAGGTFDISLSGKEVQQHLPTAAWIRLNMVRLGTPGNLSYEASIVPC